MPPRIVVIGLGNILLGDEGVGVHALRELRGRTTGSVAFHDGGTQGLSLLPFMEEASHLLILDAVQLDAPPGTVIELERDDLLSARSPVKFSAHDIALPDLLALFAFRQAERIPQIAFVGATPSSVELSVELSPPARRAVSEMVRRARKTLGRWWLEAGFDENGFETAVQIEGRRPCV